MTATMTLEQGILRRPYVLMTVGSWSLVFLAAFESLAVTTIMPIVTADLNGRGLYSLAFSATLAAGVVGMVVVRPLGGQLRTGRAAGDRDRAVRRRADRRRHRAVDGCLRGRPVSAGPGRGRDHGGAVRADRQGLSAGLHVKIFGAYASAWVLPSMVGPFAAGVVADVLSWHWVFLGVVVLVALALAMIAPSLRGHRPEPPLGPVFDGRAAGVGRRRRGRGRRAQLERRGGRAGSPGSSHRWRSW